MGKLVQDKIPELIRGSGSSPRMKTLCTQAYRDALMDTLREAVAELAAEQMSEAILAEAADLLKVLAAIAAEHGATLDTIVEIARRKRDKRKGLDMRLPLDRVDLHPARP